MTLLFSYFKKIESYIAIVVGLVSGKCYLNILMVFLEELHLYSANWPCNNIFQIQDYLFTVYKPCT